MIPDSDILDSGALASGDDPFAEAPAPDGGESGILPPLSDEDRHNWTAGTWNDDPEKVDLTDFSDDQRRRFQFHGAFTRLADEHEAKTGRECTDEELGKFVDIANNNALMSFPMTDDTAAGDPPAQKLADAAPADGAPATAPAQAEASPPPATGADTAPPTPAPTQEAATADSTPKPQDGEQVAGIPVGVTDAGQSALSGLWWGLLDKLGIKGPAASCPAPPFPPVTVPPPAPKPAEAGTRPPDFEMAPDVHIEDCDPIDLAKNPPHPDTQAAVDKIPDPDVRDVIDKVVLGSGTQNGAEEKASNIEGQGGAEQGRKDFEETVRGMGGDPSKIEPRINDKGETTYVYTDSKAGVRVIWRDTSKTGPATLEVHIPGPDGNVEHKIKKRYP